MEIPASLPGGTDAYFISRFKLTTAQNLYKFGVTVGNDRMPLPLRGCDQK
jgi:hypothetical protein